MKRPDPVFVLFNIPHWDKTLLFQCMISIWLDLFLRNGVFIQKNKIAFHGIDFQKWRFDQMSSTLKEDDFHQVNAVPIQCYIVCRWTSYWSSLYHRSRRRKLGLTLLRYHYPHNPTDWVYPKIVKYFFCSNQKTSSNPWRKSSVNWRIVWHHRKHST